MTRMLLQRKDYPKGNQAKQPTLNLNVEKYEKYHNVQISQSPGFKKYPSLKIQAEAVYQITLASTIKRLKELAQLEADWDSYGAEPVSSIALVTAFELLDAVKERLSTKGKEALPQFIAPLADGGLQLEWSREQGDIEIEIDPDGDLGYVLIEGQGENRKFTEQHQISLEEVLNLLSQFLSLNIKE